MELCKTENRDTVRIFDLRRKIITKISIIKILIYKNFKNGENDV